MIRPRSDILPPLRGQELYSLGYQLRDLGEFVQVLKDAGITVVLDVRETAWSHKRGFSKSGLEEALGHAGLEYVHASFAGNPKELRRGVEEHKACLDLFEAYLDQNLEILAELAELVRRQGSKSRVCLICYERHPDDCHRAILFRRWASQAGVELSVQHLGVGGAPRFVNAE